MSKISLASRISALCLALLTLVVFWSLQDFGPESTLRRFFEFAATDNLAGIDQVLAPSGRRLVDLTLPDEEMAREKVVVDKARFVAHYGAYHIVAAEVESQRGIIRVDYELPDTFGPDEETWVLVRPLHSRWTIDLQQTAVQQLGPL
jgi:hypothetical protein